MIVDTYPLAVLYHESPGGAEFLLFAPRMVAARVCHHCERSPGPNRPFVTSAPITNTPQPLLKAMYTHLILTSSEIAFELNSLNLLNVDVPTSNRVIILHEDPVI